MQLYYSKTSPYSRKVLLLARHLGLQDEIKVVMTNPLEPEADFLKANPLSKVPVLLEDGEPALFDSRVIAEFLLDRAGMNDTGRAKTEILKRQALADGIMDAALALVMEGRRPEAERSAYWQERWHAAIERALAHLEDGAINALDDWRLDSIATACALDYLCFRLPDINWRDGYQHTAQWYARVAAREDMKATDPRD